MKHLKYLILALGLSVCEPLMAQGGLFSLVKKVGTMIDYGFGYTVNVGGDKGSYLTFGATGGSFGINVRIHSFENSKPNINMDSALLTEEDLEEMKKVELIDPIHVNTVIADLQYRALLLQCLWTVQQYPLLSQ